MTSQALLDALVSSRKPADIRAARAKAAEALIETTAKKLSAAADKPDDASSNTLENLALAGARAIRIEDHLPPGKTYEEALTRARARKEHLWTGRPELDEDERILELEAFCTALCRGHAESGRQLATDALWS